VTVAYEPIGVVRSAYREQKGTPIQAAHGDTEATVEIDPPWREGLADLSGFERIWLVTHLHGAKAYRPRVVPYLDTEERSLFATRSPARPNPIGISCVRLLEVDAVRGVLRVEAVDLLDGTAVLDVKPYVPRFDAFHGARAGWIDGAPGDRTRADDRFE